MNLYFTIEEMSKFLLVRGYKIGKKQGYRLIESAGGSEDVPEEMYVAIRQPDVKPLAALYWVDEINNTYGLEKVFTAEMQKAMLKI